jgi:hypothetical protein
MQEWIERTALVKPKYQHIVAFENAHYLYDTIQRVIKQSPIHETYLDSGQTQLKAMIDANLDAYIDANF